MQNRTESPALYTAYPLGTGWAFATPVGVSDGHLSQSDCQRRADATRRQDTNFSGTGKRVGTSPQSTRPESRKNGTATAAGGATPRRRQISVGN